MLTRIHRAVHDRLRASSITNRTARAERRRDRAGGHAIASDPAEHFCGALDWLIRAVRESVFLDDPRFFKTPYVGQHGWVSLRVNGGRLDWKEIADLAKGSHQLITGKKK